MRHRTLERAAAAGVALSLVVAAAAFADTVRGDADTLDGGVQAERDLGSVAPGAVLVVPVGFELRCQGVGHLDPGQVVSLTLDGGTVPGDGAASMDPVTVGPVPVGWPGDGSWCAGVEAPLTAVGMARLTAPTSAGVHRFTLAFTPALSPAGEGDDAALTGLAMADLTLTVVEPTNTPPALVLPGDMTVEADGPDGWTASYAVSATDVEDDPDPVPACSPAVGAVLPLGTTIVACSVTDAGGLQATGSFAVAVAPKPDEAAPAGAVVAAFDPPVKAGALTGHAGRTIPLKVRLAAGEDLVGEGSLVVSVAPCAGGGPVAEVAMDWRAASGRWFGLLRTKGMAAGCYTVRAMHEGVDVGGFELTLVDRRAEVAKEKAAAAKEKAAAKERAAAAGEKAKPAAGSPGRGHGKGGS